MSEDEDRARQEMSSLQADESLAFGNMQELSLVADNTDNPLFLWKSLSAWFDVNLLRGKLGSELLPMPQQFQTYLAVTAKRLRDLSEGLDYKRAPEPFGELPRVWESVEIARRRTRTLSTLQATKLALHAFGLRRDGWNAFKRAEALAQKDEDALSYELFRDIGEMGDGAAVELLLEDFSTQKPSSGSGRRKVEDARGLRKRIKASRGARQPKK